jgi:signal transduction histidine kinase
VVHEVNNPLSIIKNYLSVLDNKLARHEPVVGEMSILNEEIDRVGHLINGLAELPPADGAHAAGRAGTDCARVIDDVLRLFRATDFVPASVQLASSTSEDTPEVDADPDILKQILVNLIKNAIEALPAGGRIEVANRGQVNRERKMYVELAVTDNGPGLAPEVMANLFSAVRSSKAGPHHGLGLSIVHGLVKKIDGLISCRSGRSGTSFEILLPVRGSAGSSAGAQARALDSV